MFTPRRSLARLPLLVAGAALLLTVLPSVAGAASLFPVRLEAGTHRGYTFNASGAILGSRTRVVAAPTNVSADQRAWITGRGAHLRIATGSLSGSWVKESMIAYRPGLVVTRSFATPQRTAFPRGAYVGYRFDASWRIAGTKYARLAGDSAALVA